VVEQEGQAVILVHLPARLTHRVRMKTSSCHLGGCSRRNRDHVLEPLRHDRDPTADPGCSVE